MSSKTDPDFSARTQILSDYPTDSNRNKFYMWGNATYIGQTHLNLCNQKPLVDWLQAFSVKNSEAGKAHIWHKFLVVNTVAKAKHLISKENLNAFTIQHTPNLQQMPNVDDEKAFKTRHQNLKHHNLDSMSLMERQRYENALI